MPVPSSWLSGAALEDRLGREIGIRFPYEGEGGYDTTTLVFEGVEAYRVTYMYACEDDCLEAYDKLVDCGQTSWLTSAKAAITRNAEQSDGLRHLMIYFDDGPCYEAICRSFRVETVKATGSTP